MRRIGMTSIALAISACGGSGGDDGPEGESEAESEGEGCDALAPCGGLAVGAWTFTDLCIGGASGGFQDCPQATQEIERVQIAGLASFEGTGRFSFRPTTTTTQHLSYPTTCLAGATCMALAAEIGMGATCTQGAVTCECRWVTSSTLDLVGAWTTTGTILQLLRDGGGGTINFQYCVDAEAGTLRLATTRIGAQTWTYTLARQ